MSLSRVTPASLDLPRKGVVLGCRPSARAGLTLRSRSRTSPQSPHSKTRSPSARSAFTVPQPEQVFDDGNHRSATTSSVPYQAALYTSCRRSSPKAASEMWRASLRLASMPAAFRSSITTTAAPLASSLLMECSSALRTAATRRPGAGGGRGRVGCGAGGGVQQPERTRVRQKLLVLLTVDVEGEPERRRQPACPADATVGDLHPPRIRQRPEVVGLVGMEHPPDLEAEPPRHRRSRPFRGARPPADR